MKEDDPVAKVLGQLEDVGGEDDDVVLFDGPDDLLHLQLDHDVQGSQGLIHEDDFGAEDEEHEHLELVLHPGRIVLDQAEGIRPVQADLGKVVFDGSRLLNPVGIGFDEEFQELVAGQKFREFGLRHHHKDVGRGQGPPLPSFFQKNLSPIPADLAGDDVKKGGLPRPVPAQEGVQAVLFEDVVDPLQDFLARKGLADFLQN